MAERPGRVQEGSDPSQCDSACRMVQLRAVMIIGLALTVPLLREYNETNQFLQGLNRPCE